MYVDCQIWSLDEESMDLQRFILHKDWFSNRLSPNFCYPNRVGLELFLHRFARDLDLMGQ
jgi:hypothetical protein